MCAARIRAAFVSLLLVAAAPLAAQTITPPAANPWAKATNLGMFTGGASQGGDLRPAIGWLAGWDVSRRFTIEGRTTWFDRQGEAGAFGATMDVAVNLVPRRIVTPFVIAGFGLHHAWFEKTSASMPGFYRRRTAATDNTASFTDPALMLGAGVDWLTARHLSVRPEAGVTIVHGAGRADTVGMFGVRFAYRFENHSTR